MIYFFSHKISQSYFTSNNSRVLFCEQFMSEFDWAICLFICNLYFCFSNNVPFLIGPRQANLVLIAYASSEGSGEPAHPRSLARTFAARSYKQ